MNIYLPTWITFVLSTGILLCLFLFTFKRQSTKPKWYWALLICYVGMFSFSFNFNVKEMPFQLPLLPLGVWIVYFLLRPRKRWNTYRPFAWLGFLNAFLFSFIGLLTIPLGHLLYPTNELSSYISTTDSAYVILSSEDSNIQTLDKDSLNKQLSTAKVNHSLSIEWYYNNFSNGHPSESFPYMLMETTSPFGSGNPPPQIFIQYDGKGLLITKNNHQHYFQFQTSILKEGVSQ
ncbi:MAG: hypothetical protein ACI35O_09315 [Bacillaceae bacterium]